MPEICFITTCMGRLDHLRETLGTWVAQPDASCVVVDYSCPDHCGDWVERTYPQVRVVRVTGKSRFQLVHARNVGAGAADGNWLCFLDADIALNLSFVENVLPMLRPGHFYTALPFVQELCGSVVCSQSDFAKVDGYDEVIRGWGSEDLDLYARFRLQGLTAGGFSSHLLRPLLHGDNRRVQFYEVKQKELSWTINQQYLQAKIDLMKHFGRNLSVKERQHLYEQVTDWVGKALANVGKQLEMKLVLEQHAVPIGGHVRSSLTYTMKLPGSSE